MVLIFLFSDGLDEACCLYLWTVRPHTRSNQRVRDSENKRGGDTTGEIRRGRKKWLLNLHRCSSSVFSSSLSFSFLMFNGCWTKDVNMKSDGRYWNPEAPLYPVRWRTSDMTFHQCTSLPPIDGLRDDRLSPVDQEEFRRWSSLEVFVMWHFELRWFGLVPNCFVEGAVLNKKKKLCKLFLMTTVVQTQDFITRYMEADLCWCLEFWHWFLSYHLEKH